jgi:hypothetical protein
MTAPLTPTLIMLGPSAAVRDAAIGAVLPINRHDPEYCPTPARRLMQLRCIAIESPPRAFPLAGTNPDLTSTADGPLPLSP